MDDRQSDLQRAARHALRVGRRLPTGSRLAKVRRNEKTWAEVRKDLRMIGKKVAKQVGKDYIVFPALAGRGWKHTLQANAVANLIRNYWSYAVIFCGHFPDGAEKFTREEFENETQASGTCGRCSDRRTSAPAR